MIEDAMRGWIKLALEEGIPIPEPAPDEEYSGKFVVRLPRSPHRQLAETAEREGVSLNQFINVALAQSVGHASALAYPITKKTLQFAVKEKKPKFATKKKNDPLNEMRHPHGQVAFFFSSFIASTSSAQAFCLHPFPL